MSFFSPREVIPDSPDQKTRKSHQDCGAENQSEQNSQQEDTIEEKISNIDKGEDNTFDIEVGTNLCLAKDAVEVHLVDVVPEQNNRSSKDQRHDTLGQKEDTNQLQPKSHCIIKSKDAQQRDTNPMIPQPRDIIENQDIQQSDEVEDDLNHDGEDKELEQQVVSCHQIPVDILGGEGYQLVQSLNEARFKINDLLVVTEESRCGEGTYRSKYWVPLPSKGVGRVVQVNREGSKYLIVIIMLI